MTITAIINLVIFSALLSFLYQLSKKELSLSRRVLAGLVAGIVFGFYLQAVFGSTGEATLQTLDWTSVIANSYVNLLRMIIMPLVLITMIASVMRIEELKSISKIGGSVIGVLIFTTMIAALVGIMMASVFGLDASDLSSGVREVARAEVLESRLDRVTSGSLSPDLLVGFISSNIFLDLTGARSTSVIAVMIIGLLFGIASLLVAQENAEHGVRIRAFVDTTQAVIMRLVKIVLNLTPYGVLALMTNVLASNELSVVTTFIWFVIASYMAIAIMFAVHSLMIGLLGANLKTYFTKVWPVLTFAFVTRSSAATIPLTIRVQIEELKLPAPIANFSATFGSSIGQNGCAGIYPAMLAVMVAPSLGIDIDLGFIAYLVLVVAIGSFGIAGVGGGATNAALVVLTLMDFPITVVALLISIEPLIDMARTALNVNGAITAGMITSRFLGDEVKDAEPDLASQGLSEN